MFLELYGAVSSVGQDKMKEKTFGKNTLYGIDMTEVSECELIYQKYWFSSK